MNTRTPIVFIFITRLIDSIGFGIVMPVLPQLLLELGAPDLASAVASLTSVAAIVGPFAMTQSLAFFTAPQAPVHFPGAPLVLAALLTLIALSVLVKVTARSSA